MKELLEKCLLELNEEWFQGEPYAQIAQYLDGRTAHGTEQIVEQLAAKLLAKGVLLPGDCGPSPMDSMNQPTSNKDI